MRQTVLVIDDERSFQVTLKPALEREGYAVLSAESGQRGRELWREAMPDLVILDRNLPDADGVDILAELRGEAEQRNVDAAFLVVTAYADVDNAVDALKRGADDYVTKPIQLSDLLVKLRKALETRQLRRRVRGLQHDATEGPRVLEQTRSAAMRAVLEMAQKVAKSPDTAVLLQGESGSGKDLIARYIHSLTECRKEAPFIELNCAAISEQLAESELFGHERGAFTDAKSARRGLLELADEGTLFLDEIADLHLGTQAKLLRVLESMRFRRVGGTRDIAVSVRIISATNRELTKEVEENKFRLDLFHRLNVFQLTVPPLRNRSEDIMPLSERFMLTTARRLGRVFRGITPGARRALEAYAFPGNVRELKNVIERAVIIETGDELSEKSLALSGRTPGDDHEAFFSIDVEAGGRPPSLKDVERRYIERVLALCGGNKSQAARLLEITFPTIAKKVQDYGINTR